MSISSISGGQAWLSQLMSQGGLTGVNNSSASNAASGNLVGSSTAPAGRSLFQDIASTLQQMLSSTTAARAATTAASSGSAASGTPPTAAASSTTSAQVQDLQSFMATLMQALHQAGTAGTVATTTPAASASTGTSGTTGIAAYRGHGGHGHGRVSSQLQSLLEEVDGDTPTSGSTAATSATASSTPTLQNFLQQLLQNFQTQGASAQSTGLLLQATA
jgi:hypothetical protein